MDAAADYNQVDMTYPLNQLVDMGWISQEKANDLYGKGIYAIHFSSEEYSRNMSILFADGFKTYLSFGKKLTNREVVRWL